MFQSGWSLLGSSGLEGAGDLHRGVAIVFVSGLACSFFIGRDSLRAGEIRWDLVTGLTSSAFVFNLLGVAVLAEFNQTLLKKILGLIFLTFACWQLYLKLSIIYRTRLKKQEEMIQKYEIEEKRRQQQEDREQQHEDEISGASTTSNDGEDGYDSVAIDLPSASSLSSSPPPSIPEESPLESTNVETASFLSNQQSQSDSFVSSQDCETLPPIHESETYTHHEPSSPSSSSASSPPPPPPPSSSSNKTYQSLPTSSPPVITTLEITPIDVTVAAGSNNPNAASTNGTPGGVAASSAGVTVTSPRTVFVWSPALWWSELKRLIHVREFQMSLIAGAASGFCGGAFGTAGPPIMVRETNKQTNHTTNKHTLHHIALIASTWYLTHLSLLLFLSVLFPLVRPSSP